MSVNNIGPQPGKQELFLASPCDITIYGGSAGSGKSYGLLLLPLYYRGVKDFNCIMFRRTYAEITNPGGLWDEATKLYSKIGGKPRGKPEYTVYFPKSKVVFSHLEHEGDIYRHQGGQYCVICFDELTLFTEQMFLYLMTRNRSSCGVWPRMRATCNPEADSWVKKWIQWWLDEKTGLPIEERCGVPKYFTYENKTLLFVDKDWRHPDNPSIGPKSLTFIPAKLDDNPKMLEVNPRYKADLLMQSKIDRERLLYGNWNARAEDGMFDYDWFEIEDNLPAPTSRRLRVYDRAATEKDKNNPNPDFTAGPEGYLSGDVLVVEDLQHFRASAADNEKRILKTAKIDGRDVEILIEREPASSGKDSIYYYKEKVLKDYVVRDFSPIGKSHRTDYAKPLSSLAERRKIVLKRAPWNKAFIGEFVAFPPPKDSGHDDIVCATIQLYNELLQENRIIPGYSSKNLIDQKNFPKGMDYVILYQERDLRLYGCFIRWDFVNKELYVYDEIVLQSFTIQQLKKLIKERCPGKFIGHCNDFMNTGGDSVARLLAREQMPFVESGRFNDEGCIPVVSMMFQTKQIKVHVKCVETDRQLRTWMLDNNKPSQLRVGCAKSILLAVSDLRDKKRIQPPEPPKPYSRESQMAREAFERSIGEPVNIPKTGYSQRLRHWQA
jgi:phage terminase large subunit-like protein